MVSEQPLPIVIGAEQEREAGLGRAHVAQIGAVMPDPVTTAGPFAPDLRSQIRWAGLLSLHPAAERVSPCRLTSRLSLIQRLAAAHGGAALGSSAADCTGLSGSPPAKRGLEWQT